MRRHLAIAFLLIIVALVASAVAFVRSQVAADLLCAQAERIVSEKIDGTLLIGRCEVDPWSVEIVFHEVLAEADGLTAAADEVRIRLREIQALSTDPTIEQLEILRPVVTWSVRSPVGGPPTAPVPCELPELPLRVMELRVLDGSLTADLGGGVRIEASQIQMNARREGATRRIELGLGRGSLTHPGGVESWESASARLNIDTLTLGLDVEEFAISGDDAHLTARGSAVGLCDPRIDLDLTLSGAVDRLLAAAGADPSVVARSGGRLTSTIHLRGPLEALEAGVTLEVVDARMFGHGFGDVRAQLEVDREAVRLVRVTTDVFGGETQLEGRVEFSAGLPAKFSLRAADATIERTVTVLRRPGSWVDGTFSGTASAAGTLSPIELEGVAAFRLTGLDVLRRPTRLGEPAPEEIFVQIPPAQVAGGFSIDETHLQVNEVGIRLPSSRLTVTGSFPLDSAEPMDLGLEVEELELGRDLGRIAGVDYTGVLTGTVQVTGTYGDPRIEGRADTRGFTVAGIKLGVAVGRFVYDDFVLSLHDTHGQKGRTSYSIDQMVWPLRDGPDSYEIRVTIREGRAEDVVAAMLEFHPFTERLSSLIGSGSGYFHIVGPTRSLSVRANATLGNGSFRGQRFEALKVRGRYEDGRRFEVEEFVATLGNGTARVRGWWEVDGGVALSVQARDLPAENLALLELPELRGRLSGDVSVGGTWNAPTASGNVSLLEGAYREVPLRPIRLTVDLADRRLVVKGELSGKSVTGEGFLELGPERAFAATVQVDEEEVERWLPPPLRDHPVVTGWTGALKGSGQLSGRLDRPETWEGRAVIEQFEGERDGLRVRSDGPVRLVVAHGGVAVERLVLAGPSSKLTITGVRSLRGELDLTVHGGAELELVAIIAPQVERASGVITLQANVTGTFERPVLVGSGRLVGGAFSVKGTPIVMTELRGPIAFSQNRVILDGLTGLAGRGRVDLDGEITLRNFLPETIRIAARLDEVSVRPGEGLRTVLSGGLYLDGKLDKLFLSGELEVVRGRYDRELEVDQMIPWFQRKVEGARSTDRAPWMRLDIGVKSHGTIELDSGSVQGVLGADLRIVGTDVRPSIVGTVTSLWGRALFRGNEFDITSAILSFDDPNRIRATFDIHADAEVRDYQVFIHAFGTPERSRVMLTSEPELPEADLLTLLTFGLTTQDADRLQGGDAAIAVMDALFVASGLDRQVRKFLPDNQILRAPTLRLTSGYSRGRVEPRVAFESRLFVDNLRLRYSAPIGVPGQRAQAEYKITDTISAQAEWDTESRESDVGNLGIDLKLRWELE